MTQGKGTSAPISRCLWVVVTSVYPKRIRNSSIEVDHTLIEYCFAKGKIQPATTFRSTLTVRQEGSQPVSQTMDHYKPACWGISCLFYVATKRERLDRAIKRVSTLRVRKQERVRVEGAGRIEPLFLRVGRPATDTTGTSIAPGESTITSEEWINNRKEAGSRALTGLRYWNYESADTPPRPQLQALPLVNRP